MATAYSDIMAARTAADIKAQFLALCVANGLPVTAWPLGDPSERWVEITPRAIFAVLGGVTTQAVRGMFLDLATDPGDPGDLSDDQTPRAGFLSALGEGWYGTTRGGQTYATTTVTIQNDDNHSITFSPFDLTFTTDVGEAAKGDGGRPTYRNTQNDTLYDGIGGTITLTPGAVATDLPVKAEQIGGYGNASAGSLVCVTQTFGTLTVTASALAIGTEREDADLYRARCRLAASKLAYGGPGGAYKYAANTAKDGTPLQRWDGSGPVGITKSYVSPSNAEGTVLVFYGDDDGAADTVDVQSASVNTLGIALGVITDPMGVVPDAVTFGSTTSSYGGELDAGTPIGAPTTNVDVTIVATAKIKRVRGISDTDLKAAAEAAAKTVAMPTYFKALDIGGRDQTAGAGVLPTEDLSGVIYGSYPGLHAVAITTPAGSSTALALGHQAHLASFTFTVSVVA